jgi:hypothetical protein
MQPSQMQAGMQPASAGASISAPTFSGPLLQRAHCMEFAPVPRQWTGASTPCSTGGNAQSDRNHSCSAPGAIRWMRTRNLSPNHLAENELCRSTGTAAIRALPVLFTILFTGTAAIRALPFHPVLFTLMLSKRLFHSTTEGDNPI